MGFEEHEKYREKGEKYQKAFLNSRMDENHRKDSCLWYSRVYVAGGINTG